MHVGAEAISFKNRGKKYELPLNRFEKACENSECIYDGSRSVWIKFDGREVDLFQEGRDSVAKVKPKVLFEKSIKFTLTPDGIKSLGLN